MAAPPYMKLYIADYTADVQHLSCEQDGAYWRLLRAMWRAGGKLPNKPEKLATICGLTVERWAEIGPDVIDLFKVNGGQLTHKRMTAELSKYQRTSKARSEARKGGHSEKGNENNEQASDFVDQKGGVCGHNQNQNQNQSLPVSNDTGPEAAEVVDLAERVEDLDQQAWNAAVDVLTTQGRVNDKAARSFFGRLLKDTQLQARDLLPSLASAKVNRTQDPQSYLRRCAEQVAQRRGVGGQPKQVEWC